MKNQDKILVIDYGSQYSHLIARRIRDLGVFSQVISPEQATKITTEYQEVTGLILSGGAYSVADKKAPQLHKQILTLAIPILGICYGHQLLVKHYQGKVSDLKVGEYGLTDLSITRENLLFKGMKEKIEVWMNHQDVVAQMPPELTTIASSKNSAVAAFCHKKLPFYGLQFHPEVSHTPLGKKMLANFAFEICKSQKSWKTKDIISKIRTEILEQVAGKKAVIALSGGIDSTVAALLCEPILRQNLTAVFVDTGLMRYREKEFMKKNFSHYNFQLKIISAQKKFFDRLKGISYGNEKRRIIGKTFIDLFTAQIQNKKDELLIQGTIFSDRIESGHTKNSSKIKLHHNVGGLPKNLKVKIYEPLRDLYKDEVREIAKELGVSEELRYRNVFPGVGNAVRITGEVTAKKALIVQKASYILEQELKQAGLYHKVWMGFAILLSIKSVGIQGDKRSYKFPVVLRIVESSDAMSAKFSFIPHSLLSAISHRITNEIPEVNRVLYDITNKPPATMEWE